MSKLEQLIKDKCPNGVEYVKLGEVCTITKGKTPIQKAIPGEYPLVVTTSERKSCNTYQFDNAAVCIPLVSSRGHGVASLNHVYFQSGKFALGNILCAVIPNDENILSANFLFHYLEYKKDTLLVPLMKGGANVSLHIDDIQRVKIPLPPVEIQSKIIEILDKFVELSEVLSKELTARKKQYEYYRDLLLDFDVHGGGASEYEWHTLGEICSITDGSHFSPKEVAEGYYMPSVKDMRNDGFDFSLCKKISKADYELLVRNGCRPQPNDVLIAKDGATMLKHAFVASGTEDIVILSSIAILRPNTDIIFPKYLAHYFRQEGFKEMVIRNYSSVGGVPRIVLKNFKRIKIAIPPMEEQTRVVSILDRFDKLCNDISEGLPAEIEARRKQYEYYRDKLLSFNVREC